MSHGHSHDYDMCMECQRMSLEVLNLSRELAKYKPPDPLFDISMVLITAEGHPMKVKARRYAADTRTWWYTSGYSGKEYLEESLRKLNYQEMGVTILA